MDIGQHPILIEHEGQSVESDSTPPQFSPPVAAAGASTDMCSTSIRKTVMLY